MTAANDVKNWTPVDAVATLAADAEVYKAVKAKEREGSRTDTQGNSLNVGQTRDKVAAFAGVSQVELLRNQQRAPSRATGMGRRP
jgi:hypothetical protein